MSPEEANARREIRKLLTGNDAAIVTNKEPTSIKSKIKSFVNFCIGLSIVIFIFNVATSTNKNQQPTIRYDGLHCLSGWDGSNTDLKNLTIDRLRDPDSFKHVNTHITSVVNGEHKIYMTYRAKNGFGGYTTAMSSAVLDTSCKIKQYSIAN